MSAPASPEPHAAEHPVVLFDGVCNLCNAAVNFIIDHDAEGVFHFASLQSAAAEGLLERCPEMKRVDSIVLVEGARCYAHSTAVLRIARRLDRPWSLLALFRIVPRVIRDPAYRWIARNRHRWFGTREACRVPTPDVAARFLAA